MAKQSGLGDRLWWAGRNVSGDIGSLQRIAGGPNPLEVTGIDKSAIERLGGERTGGFQFLSFFNDSAVAPVGAHTLFSALPTTDTVVTYGRGAAIGSPAAACVAKQVNYETNRPNDGSLTSTTTAESNGFGLEWGYQLTAGDRTDTTSTNGTSLDLLTVSPGAFGLQAYLHVSAFTGTNVTIKIQESGDNGAGDAFADVVGGTFTVVTAAPASERIATAAINVERYLRVVTTGTFSSVTFAVMATRNPVAVTF